MPYAKMQTYLISQGESFPAPSQSSLFLPQFSPNKLALYKQIAKRVG